MKQKHDTDREKSFLHILKLCVGCSSIAELEAWIADVSAHDRRTVAGGGILHTTRMVPKRMDEILGGGSLFWVIKGQIACRQRILDIQPDKLHQRVSVVLGSKNEVDRVMQYYAQATPA